MLPILGQDNVVDGVGLAEQRGYFFVGESCNAAADACDEECEFGMRLGERDEFVHIRTDGVDASLHGGDGVAPALQSYALSHDGSELAVGRVGGATAVQTIQVAAENEYLVRLQFGNEFRGGPFVFHMMTDEIILVQKRSNLMPRERLRMSQRVTQRLVVKLMMSSSLALSS